MINWKTSVGISLLMIAGIEFLKIKDHFNPERVTQLVIFLISGFILTTAIATVLLVKGLKRNYHRTFD